MKYAFAALLVLVTSLGCSQVPKNFDMSSLFEVPEKTAHGQPKAAGRVANMFAAARSLEQQGHMDEAKVQYSKINKEYPKHAPTLHRLAVLEDKAGNSEEATRLYLRGLHFTPEDADLLCDYGYSRYLQGDLLQAEQLLRRAIAAEAHFQRAHNNLGLVLAQQGKDQAAVAAFEQAGLTRQEAQRNLQQSRVAASLSEQESPARTLETVTAQGTNTDVQNRAKEAILDLVQVAEPSEPIVKTLSYPKPDMAKNLANAEAPPLPPSVKGPPSPPNSAEPPLPPDAAKETQARVKHRGEPNLRRTLRRG